MIILACLLMLTPAYAQESHPWEDLSGQEVCELIKRELLAAVDYGSITPSQAERLHRNCLDNYGRY